MNFKPIPYKFEYLNWQEIESIAEDKRSTVIWPFGAVEQHGPHLPLATDSICLLYTSPSPRDRQKSRMPSSA